MFKYLLIILPLLASAQDEKRVIGADTRVQIKTPTNFTRTIGVLIKDKAGFCTATLIDSTHILTNGHCVVKNNEKFPTSLESPAKYSFVPGMLQLGQAPSGVFKVKKIQAFREYVYGGDMGHDIAVLTLTKALNLPTIRRMRVADSREIEGRGLVITGYSSGKPMGTLWEGRGVTRSADNDNLVSHDVDTLPGSSGSIMRINYNGSLIAIGIHRGGIGLVNNGVYFTPEVYDAIDRWLKN